MGGKRGVRCDGGLAARLPRRLLLASGGLLATPGLLRAQPRGLRIIVPFTPGGSVDVPTRLIAAEMAKLLGQPVVVENRPGAGGGIGIEALARSAPDGATLGVIGVGNTAVLPKLNPRLGYVPARDLRFVAFMNTTEFVLVTRPGLPARTLAEVVEMAKGAPGRLTYGSAGRGSSYQLSFEGFKLRAGIEVLEIPFAGDAPLLTELLADRVDLAIMAASSARPQVAAGGLRLLAAAGGERVGLFPETPTIAELAYPGFEAVSWNILAAPVGTPDAVVQQMHEAAMAAVRVPEVRARFAAQGMNTRALDLVALHAFVLREIDNWGGLIDRIGLRPD
jgi:tripartite-type tricarboxylate transporter receptor subunit TctC